MISVRPARPGDIEHIGKTAAEQWVREATQTIDLSAVLANPHTLVAEIDGEPTCAGGYVDMGNGVAIAWALVGQVPKRMFVPLCRLYRSHLRRAPFHWIEAHCVEGFEQSFRWVRCLGFEPLQGARLFAPDGREFKRFIFRG